MNIGDLKHRIQILEKRSGSALLPSEQCSKDNDYYPWKSDDYYIYSAIDTMKGSNEFWQGQSTYTLSTYRFTIRYIDGIKQNMRIKYKDRILRIISITNIDEENRFLQLIGQEVR